ncbi:MAG: response regulator [Desulfomonile tiedjei]|nr:response regulator [Desulfomonile tiedjei]
MNRSFRILIADKNRHVREFLRREFREAGYRVQVAKDSQEVIMMIDVKEPPDLLILDLEMPQGDALETLEWLESRLPPLPVVIHSFPAEHPSHAAIDNAAAVVEKEGDTNRLKKVVVDVLRRYYPERFRPSVSGPNG